MRDSWWIGATALAVAIMAVGLGIAALVLALDDGDAGSIDGRFNRVVAPEAPIFPDGRGDGFGPGSPSPTPGRPGDALPDRDAGTGRALLGVTVGATDSASGVLVEVVDPGTPADEAGLESGDIVTAVDGEAVDGPAALVDVIGEKAPGDAITLTVERDGDALELETTLGEQSSLVPRSQFPAPGDDSPFERLPFGRGDGLNDLLERFGFGELEGLDGQLVLSVASVVEVSDDEIRVAGASGEQSFEITDATRFLPSAEAIVADQRVLVVASEGEALVIVAQGIANGAPDDVAFIG
jgi:membrane-associated protease RseP (regulator of RpoE activity)